MGRVLSSGVTQLLRSGAVELRGDSSDFDRLLDRIGEASFVLLGEATHGTHEFYRVRAAITKRLITQKGFSAVAVEADWPDAYRINRFVRAEGADRRAIDALADFQRFPKWMWRNADVLDFIGWLREFNEQRPAQRRAGFYGLDLYSLYRSIAAIIRYLDEVDPDAAQRARLRYACFDHSGLDAQQYGLETYLGARPDCQQEAVAQLIDLRHSAAEQLRRDGLAMEDAQFFAEQNARVVQNADAYYRNMFTGRRNTWNLRDEHMADTLAALHGHLSRHGEPARVVVWAHNSHLGDASATQMGDRGEWNLGQLARSRWPGKVVLIGFTTHEGDVAAASNWGGEVERKRVRPSLPGSVERAFHDAGIGNFLTIFDDVELATAFRPPMLERAIGVIYKPETERQSHYFHSSVSGQFDAVLHYDRTRAVEPLDVHESWDRTEAPETFPTGL